MSEGKADPETADRSAGWEAIAGKFMAVRSRSGVDVVEHWSQDLPDRGCVLDVGCGSGVPISETLIARDFEVFGIDASPTLVSAFRARFPSVPVACEPAQDSELFGQSFDGAVAVGLLFLLPAEDQREVIRRIATALKPGGLFLFNAPREACEWQDILTGEASLSLGLEEYRRVLERCGIAVVGTRLDAGENHYIEAARGFG